MRVGSRRGLVNVECWNVSQVGKCHRLEVSHILCIDREVYQAGKCQNSDWKSRQLICFLALRAIDTFVKVFLELFLGESLGRTIVGFDFEQSTAFYNRLFSVPVQCSALRTNVAFIYWSHDFLTCLIFFFKIISQFVLLDLQMMSRRNSNYLI